MKLANVIGTINPPAAITSRFGTAETGGLGLFMNLIVNLLIAGAGIYAFINFILAGYDFISAGGDSKKVGAAWGKITNTITGLVIIAASFVFAALLGLLLFGNTTALLNPVLF
jgi:hypothetical protein